MNIYQIAKKAGVSIATVSRVINNSASVSEKTKEKVNKVIEEDDYKPNIFARGLTLDSIKIIGVICTDVNDAFVAKALSFLQKELHKMNYDILLFCVGSNQEPTLKHVRYLQNKHVDAIFLVGSTFSDSINKEQLEEISRTTPMIIINGSIESENIYSVYCDDEFGLKEAVKLLCSKGHSRIMFFYDILTQSTKRKIEGFKKGFSECGLEFTEDLLVCAGDSLSSSFEKMSKIIDDKNSPDAIIASSDIIAIGALKACQENNVFPNVLGFDNTYLCDCCTPTLSSIDPKTEELCINAIKILDSLQEKEVPAKTTMVKPEIIFRETFK